MSPEPGLACQNSIISSTAHHATCVSYGGQSYNQLHCVTGLYNLKGMNKSFVDLQLNGYGGVDFNGKSINADELHAACELLDTHGVKAILATVITDDVDRMCGRLRQIVEIADADPLVKRIIAGLHVEGPFINENAGYRGAYFADQIKPANVSDAAKLVEAGNGMVKIFTLAPERDEGKKVTRFLAEKGIKVAAGHTNAPMRDLEEACDAGLTLFTHLGNGCPMN